MQAAEELSRTSGVLPACRALGVVRATLYRHRGRLRHPGIQACAERSHPRALTLQEQQAVLAELRSERFVDQAPAAVYAGLLDEGRYLCSQRTMYRLLSAAGELRERRDQLRHPAYAKPELLATCANEVWSWDITKLLGPAKWTYFYLYVLLDIFSRYVVGWMVAHRESDRGELEKAVDPARTTHGARRPGLLDDLQTGGADALRSGSHQDSFAASREQRQPVLGGAIQDAEVPARVPGPVRLRRGRARLLRRVLRLVQQRALPLGSRAAHAGDRALRRNCRRTRAARPNPGERLRATSGAVRASGASTGRATEGGMDQSAETGWRKRSSTVNAHRSVSQTY